MVCTSPRNPKHRPTSFAVLYQGMRSQQSKAKWLSLPLEGLTAMGPAAVETAANVVTADRQSKSKRFLYGPNAQSFYACKDFDVKPTTIRQDWIACQKESKAQSGKPIWMNAWRARMAVLRKKIRQSRFTGTKMVCKHIRTNEEAAAAWGFSSSWREKVSNWTGVIYGEYAHGVESCR